MTVFGIICITILVIIAIVLLYRKVSIPKRYAKTVGEIIGLKNMVPLVNKTPVIVKGKHIYTECKYQGDVFVTVRFIGKDGNEYTRRYNSSEPLNLKINEHKKRVNQYTTIFPDWRIGRKIKVFYDPANTLDMFVGRVKRAS